MNVAPRYAMLLAAGLGLRMRPLTDDRPKPLVDVDGKKLIDHALDWLESGGIEKIVVNGHYRSEQLREHLASRSGKAEIRFLHEDVLLETGGGVCNALDELGEEPFLVVNSDTICVNGMRHAITRMAEAWDASRMDSLLLLHPLERAIGFSGAGDFFLCEKGTLAMRGEAPSAPYVFTGVQMMHPRLLAGYRAEPFSLSAIFRARLASNGAGKLYGLEHDGDWLHIGDPAGRDAAEAWLKQRQAA